MSNYRFRSQSQTVNTALSIRSFPGSDIRFYVSPGSEKEAKIIKIAKTFNGPGMLISHDPEQSRYLAELLDDSNVKCSVFTVDSILEDNQRSLENLFKSRVKLFITDESSCRELPVEMQFRFIIHEFIPDSLDSMIRILTKYLIQPITAYHFLLYDEQDMYIKRKILAEETAGTDTDLTKKLEALKYVYDYCFRAGCRIKYLKSYFFGKGKYPECGNCDLCKKKLSRASGRGDDKEKIKTILVCITETREKFGKNTICDILRGTFSVTVRSYMLYRAKTFALMRDVRRKNIREILEKLCADKILRQTRGIYPTISISPSGRKMFDLSGVKTLELPKKLKIAPGDEIDLELIDQIRDLRRAKARELDLPAFMVFRDRVLKEIVQNVPQTREDLIGINGFGEKSWNICGRALLKLLATIESRTK